MTALAYLGSSGAERYTKPKILEPVRLALGEIDLDPCSSEIAQRHVRAENWFNAEINGLRQDWCRENRKPARVWCNPPSSRAGFVDADGTRHHEPCIWWMKLLAEVGAGRVVGACFMIFNAETFRHMAQYKVPHPADGRLLWLYDRPSYLTETGDEIRDEKTGKKQSPTHIGVIAIVGRVDTHKLESIGRMTGRA